MSAPRDYVQELTTLCRSYTIDQETTQSLIGFWNCYAQAIQAQSHDEKEGWKTFVTLIEQVVYYLKHPFHFAAFHQAKRTPFDYYKLGLDFVRPLIDMRCSTVSGIEVLTSFEKTLARKENIILFANHQAEIDPQIISVLIEKHTPQLAENMIFVAGHRVTTDPLAVPLSLGRNLFCIYSKRHVDNPPEKKAEKLAHNSRTLKVMQELLSHGGCCIYVAPSGGRDRRNEEGVVEVAPLDPQSVEMFYLMGQKAKNVHFHTLALSTYALLPPPNGILQEIGAKRITHFAPAHLFFGPELDMEALGNAHNIEDKKLRRKARADAIWQQIVDEYTTFSRK